MRAHSALSSWAAFRASAGVEPASLTAATHVVLGFTTALLFQGLGAGPELYSLVWALAQAARGDFEARTGP